MACEHKQKSWCLTEGHFAFHERPRDLDGQRRAQVAVILELFLVLVVLWLFKVAKKAWCSFDAWQRMRRWFMFVSLVRLLCEC